MLDFLLMVFLLQDHLICGISLAWLVEWAALLYLQRFLGPPVCVQSLM
jgi:hypothetical protein